MALDNLVNAIGSGSQMPVSGLTKGNRVRGIRRVTAMGETKRNEFAGLRISRRRKANGVVCRY